MIEEVIGWAWEPTTARWIAPDGEWRTVVTVDDLASWLDEHTEGPPFYAWWLIRAADDEDEAFATPKAWLCYLGDTGHAADYHTTTIRDALIAAVRKVAEAAT